MKRIFTGLILMMFIVGCTPQEIVEEPIVEPEQETVPTEIIPETESEEPVSEPDKQEPKIEEPKEIEYREINLNKQFDPIEIEITKGTTVMWKNNGHAVHRLLGKPIPYDSSKNFKLERVAPGENVSYTFEETGEFMIYSAAFQAIQGKVIVK